MKLHLNESHDLLLIRSYSADRITLGEQHYHTSLLVTPDKVVANWGPTAISDLQEQDFKLMLKLTPEVVLLGTGRRMQFPARVITRPLLDQSIGLEVMDTSAACRTYNVLAGEGRRVLAALIIESPSDG